MVMESSQERRPARTGRLSRRKPDRLGEAAAWLLFAGGLFLFLWGVTGAAGVHGDVVDRGLTAERARPEAVPPADALPIPAAPGPVPAGTAAGVWVDLDGRPTAPPTRAQAAPVGITAGVGVVVLGGVALGGGWLGVRRWRRARRSTAWAREWSLVEPEWSTRAR